MQQYRPFVSAYMVRRIEYLVDPTTNRVYPQWELVSRRDPMTARVVNTTDIEEVLKLPNMFMIGWQEIHYEMVTEQVKDRLMDRNREIIITKEHPINSGLVLMISELYKNAEQSQGIVQIPRVESFEQILFRLGWQFQWQPIGNGEDNDGLTGAVISPEILEKLAEEPELKQWFSRQNLTVPEITVPVTAPILNGHGENGVQLEEGQATFLNVLAQNLAQMSELIHAQLDRQGSHEPGSPGLK